MNYIPVDCYAGILSAAMDSYGVGCKRFEEVLEDKGIYGIKRKRINEYRNGKFTPPFPKAKAMLEALDFPISDGDLLKALELNKTLIKNETVYQLSEDKELRLSVRLKYKDLLRGVPPEATEFYLRQRITDLCGDESMKKLYIERLIAKDLQEYIVDKEDYLEN